MELIIREQADILEVQNELMNILPQLKEQAFRCEIKPYKPRRSLDANAYFHVLVDKISKVLKTSAEEVKVRLNLDYGTLDKDEDGQVVSFKALKSIPISKYFKYAKSIVEIEENGKVFVEYLIYKETHTLDSKEMSVLIDGTIEEAKALGIQTLTPIELENLKGYKEEK